MASHLPNDSQTNDSTMPLTFVIIAPELVPVANTRAGSAPYWSIV